MKTGKIPDSLLKKIVFDKIKHIRNDIALRPGTGEDCCAVDFGNEYCVMSCDPITGTKKNIGRLAVHISCNDIASSGAEPVGLIVTILVPNSSDEKEIEFVMNELCDIAYQMNVEIMGGHTEVTDAVSRFVIVTTVVGRICKDKMITTKGARPGDDIIMTKGAGIEGTAIIASEKEKELTKEFGKEFTGRAKAFIEKISVVNEGKICSLMNVNSMHDITEGGILGAVWEVGEASKTGSIIYHEKIPVFNETKKICSYFNIDPLKLISSGSMLITAENGEEIINKLAENGIKASVIGKVTKDKIRILKKADGTVEHILQPEADHLYDII